MPIPVLEIILHFDQNCLNIISQTKNVKIKNGGLNRDLFLKPTPDIILNSEFEGISSNFLHACNS